MEEPQAYRKSTRAHTHASLLEHTLQDPGAHLRWSLLRKSPVNEPDVALVSQRSRSYAPSARHTSGGVCGASASGERAGARRARGRWGQTWRIHLFYLVNSILMYPLALLSLTTSLESPPLRPGMDNHCMNHTSGIIVTVYTGGSLGSLTFTAHLEARWRALPSINPSHDLVCGNRFCAPGVYRRL